MTNRFQFCPDDSLSEDLKEVARLVETAALNRDHDSIALLSLLRLLEHLHREIRDSLFRDALPAKRQHLYTLLRDIELQGGWPYIPRMKLQEFLEALLATELKVDTSSESETGC